MTLVNTSTKSHTRENKNLKQVRESDESAANRVEVHRKQGAPLSDWKLWLNQPG